MQTLPQNGTHHNGVYSTPQSDYPAHAPQPPRPRWTDHEPAHVHSVKWVDSDGCEHLHVVRADTIDEALVQIRTLKHFIKAARAKDATQQEDTPGSETPEPAKGWCATHEVWMKRHQKGEQAWYSHKTPDGAWCRGA